MNDRGRIEREPASAAVDELRQQASEACGKGDWATCSDRLEAAAKLDPAGDSERTVRDLRHEVEDNIRPGRQVGAKPGLPR